MATAIIHCQKCRAQISFGEQEIQEHDGSRYIGCPACGYQQPIHGQTPVPIPAQENIAPQKPRLITEKNP